MPNRNYRAGRAFEYETKGNLEREGFIVLRTAGSHGKFDLIAIKGPLVYLVQCKKTTSRAVAERLINQFHADPPLPKQATYCQCLVVKLKGQREPLWSEMVVVWGP